MHFDYCTTANIEFVILDESTFRKILQVWTHFVYCFILRAPMVKNFRTGIYCYVGASSIIKLLQNNSRFSGRGIWFLIKICRFGDEWLMGAIRSVEVRQLNSSPSSFRNEIIKSLVKSTSPHLPCFKTRST